jgi:hypothetical protein
MRKLLILILAVTLFSCSKEKSSQFTTVDVQEVTGPAIKFISEIASDVQYIPLETTPDNPMRFIREVRYVNEKYYIYSVGEILCFDKSGRYLYKLSKQGKGPDEYLYLADFEMIPEKNLVIIFSGGKILYYSENSDGFQFVKSVNLGDRASVANLLPGSGNILFNYSLGTGINPFQGVVLSPEGDTLLKIPNKYMFTRINPKLSLGYSFENIILSNRDELKYKCLFNDTIYMIDKELHIKPWLVLNTGGKYMKPDFLMEITNPDMAGMASKFLQIQDIKEYAGYLLFRYSLETDRFFMAYNMAAGTLHPIDAKSFLTDDIAGGVNIDPKTVYDGILYTWTDALTFKNHVAGESFKNSVVKDPSGKAHLEEFGNKLSETDNFILIRVIPKK